jgi:hypothetical protein
MPSSGRTSIPREQEFTVSVCRIGYAHREVKVRATSRNAAEAQALALAPSHDFVEHESGYKVTGCLRAGARPKPETKTCAEFTRQSCPKPERGPGEEPSTGSRSPSSSRPGAPCGSPRSRERGSPGTGPDAHGVRVADTLKPPDKIRKAGPQKTALVGTWRGD